MSTAPRLEAAKRDWGHDETGCTVLHIDMDAFYASLEVARNPGLKGKPVIIGTGPRAVVSAASYEARKYGINSAMPAARAHRLCPNGIFLPVDMAYYRMMSHRIMHEVFLTVTDRFEQVSVDEGYMDVSAALLEWGRPSAIGAWIRAQVAERFHVTCSVGIACNKLVSKMASTNAKPDGMLLIPAARSAEFVQMMPLRGIPGIGPSLEKRLNAWGVHSVAELAQLDEAALTRATGSWIMGGLARVGFPRNYHGTRGEIHWVRGNLGRGYTRYARGVWATAFGLRRSNQHAAEQGAGGAHADGEVAVRRPELSDPVFYDGAADRYGRRAVPGMRAAAESHAGATGLGGVCHSPAQNYSLGRYEHVFAQ